MESLAERVRKLIADPVRIDSNLPGITCAASLAHHKLLGFLETLFLWNVDLTSVPGNHLASLVSGGAANVFIQNNSDCSLVSILDSVKCKLLRIKSYDSSNQSLEVVCRALVRAMKSRVEKVLLHEMKG